MHPRKFEDVLDEIGITIVHTSGKFIREQDLPTDRLPEGPLPRAGSAPSSIRLDQLSHRTAPDRLRSRVRYYQKVLRAQARLKLVNDPTGGTHEEAYSAQLAICGSSVDLLLCS